MSLYGLASLLCSGANQGLWIAQNLLLPSSEPAKAKLSAKDSRFLSRKVSKSLPASDYLPASPVPNYMSTYNVGLFPSGRPTLCTIQHSQLQQERAYLT